ncbi:MAG: hypothetical protein QNJ91_03515 [Gammaproteobacteria bacterium]|nr:hypothetical protein [Gammaproteobacteria bacterium]
MQRNTQTNLAEEIILRGAVWSLIGVIFGSLFVLLAEALVARVPEPFDLVLATVGAAALTSLFYGSMRLTVMVANFTFIAMLVYTWQGPSTLDLMPLVFIGAGVGVAVGAAYGFKDKSSRVFCAEAKIIAGAVAGVVAGMLVLIGSLLFDGVTRETLAMVAAPVGVLAYISLAGWFISRCHHLLPTFVDGTVVGLGVGSVTGLVFLIMAGTLDSALLGSEALQRFVGRVEASWGSTVVACALACLPVGVVRAILRVPWYDR